MAAECRIRIEMQQIGVKGMRLKWYCVALGLEERALLRQIYESIRIGLRQNGEEANLALNPTKIFFGSLRPSDVLPGLRISTYVDLKKDLPKVGKYIITRSGKGKVIRQNVLRQTVTVSWKEGKSIPIHASQL